MEVAITNTTFFNSLLIIYIIVMSIIIVTVIISSQNNIEMWYGIFSKYLIATINHIINKIGIYNMIEYNIINLIGNIWNNTRLELYKYRLNYNCCILYYILVMNLFIYNITIQGISFIKIGYSIFININNLYKELLIIKQIAGKGLALTISKVSYLYYQFYFTFLFICLTLFNIIFFKSFIFIFICSFLFDFIFNTYYLLYYHNHSFHLLANTALFNNINIKLAPSDVINKKYNINQIIFIGVISEVLHINSNFVSFKINVFNYNSEYIISGYIPFENIKFIHKGNIITFINQNSKKEIKIEDIKYLCKEHYQYFYSIPFNLLDNNILIQYDGNILSNSINKRDKIISKKTYNKDFIYKNYEILHISKQNIH